MKGYNIGYVSAGERETERVSVLEKPKEIDKQVTGG